MPDPFEDLNKRLAQLLAAIMKETDPAKYDQLGDEIWRVLGERELLASKPPARGKTD